MKKYRHDPVSCNNIAKLNLCRVVIYHDLQNYNYHHDNTQAKQNNTLVSGIPPTLAKWGRPWYFLGTNKFKKKNKKNKKKNIIFLTNSPCKFFFYT